jgi:hypothetical protein
MHGLRAAAAHHHAHGGAHASASAAHSRHAGHGACVDGVSGDGAGRLLAGGRRGEKGEGCNKKRAASGARSQNFMHDICSLTVAEEMRPFFWDGGV